MPSLSLFNRLILALVTRLWRFRQFKGRLFIVDHLLPFVDVMASRYGPWLRVRRDDFTNRAAIFGVYGDEIARQIGTLREDAVFLDIGANTGVFSLLAATRTTRGTVFAFEPNQQLFQDLCFNIGVNGATGIIPLNIALSDRTGTFGLAYNEGHTGAAALQDLNDRWPAGKMDHESIVIAIAPKELGALLHAAEDGDVCIKLDVEGHELNVLQGLKEAGILDRAAWVIVEIDPAYLERFGASAAKIYALMKSVGLEPAKGIGHAAHYDEVFARPPGMSVRLPEPGADETPQLHRMKSL